MLRMLGGAVGYSAVPEMEPEDADHGVDYASPFDFNAPSTLNMGSAFTFRSPEQVANREGFPSKRYARDWVLGKRFRDEHVLRTHSGQLSKSLFESVVIIFCYGIMFITLPFSLFFCLRFVAQFERLVVFRLGRLQAAKGPGTVFLLPCIDHWNPVDLRTKAFHVPPLQVITRDNGLVELGATVYYHIKDALAAINSVQDWNQATRTLAHTTMQRLLNKKEACDIDKKKREIAAELVDELNSSTFAWGMEITEVQFSDVRVIKAAQNNNESVIKALSNPEVAGRLFSQFAAQMSGGMPGIPQAVELCGDEVKTVAYGGGPAAIAAATDAVSPSSVAIDMDGEPAPINVDVEKLVYTLRSVLSPTLVEEVGHKYQVMVNNCGAFVLDLSPGSGAGRAVLGEEEGADVVIHIGKDDLMSMIIGELSPFDAYLSGKVSVDGNPRVAIKLEALAKHIKAKYGSGSSQE